MKPRDVRAYLMRCFGHRADRGFVMDTLDLPIKRESRNCYSATSLSGSRLQRGGPAQDWNVSLPHRRSRPPLSHHEIHLTALPRGLPWALALTIAEHHVELGPVTGSMAHACAMPPIFASERCPRAHQARADTQRGAASICSRPSYSNHLSH